MHREFTIGVVGNPNCGKTTLFNALTGSRQRVGNWPGVTVERKIGRYRFSGADFQLVDLPGTYSLDVTDRDLSLDERLARDYIHEREADLILNILDATNLERNLYLTTQLIEMGRPVVVALNMMDAARERGLRIDVDTISAGLGCPVVPISAATGEGIHHLKDVLHQCSATPPTPRLELTYDRLLESAIAALLPRLEPIACAQSDPPRWLATRLLEGDDLVRSLVGDRVPADEVKSLLGDQADDVDIMLADARYGFAHALTQAAVKHTAEVPRNISDRIDRVMLNRLAGIPIFLLVMYLMFMFTINIGGAFIDLFDQAAGVVFVDGTAELLGTLHAPEWLTLLLADGLGGGIQVVATFIPIIAFLYIFLSVLEDSGYMARAAFVVDRFMRAIGLPGKSFVPLLVGFGCNVPAIMATRTLENQRDRILTILMAPFMSCGARLPVYALFAAAFFPVGGQNVVFGLYLIGIAVAVVTGFILKNTLLKGEATPFVMELPPYHLPTLKGVALRTLDRTQGFVVRAGRIIVPMVLVLNVLNSVGTDGSYGNEDSDRSVLAEIGRTLAPAFAPMGLDEENWPATVGIFTGILAKEAVVGTLDATYSALAAADAGIEADQEEAEPYDLLGGLAGALASVPANLNDAFGSWVDPMGLSIGELTDPQIAAESQEVTTTTFGAMAARFDGAAGAFAYLLFILLYAPCVAAIAAVYRETTPGWTVFAVAWTTGMGYLAATLFYQVAIFSRDPASSATWIAIMLALFAAAVVAMRLWVRRTPTTARLAGRTP
ncbi:ferrous iron transporter FeoB [Thioflavicoccus mobilis 8321]|uniref:Ferrous iron transport protein B n=1 Tax=Thioflavicoccus mobilis 8321 TaxID=765912 RepID=L0GYW2_9GAMM|nr:Fe(2+) transporter permease subunit FeoB [Thioflavicoccus mobilis]AGA90565.1 ferrous iron transporter FeoB [Thioflavicoccus mobilis 8321]